MQSITVRSRTQRLIITPKPILVVGEARNSVRVVEAGPIGPAGPPGVFPAQAAEGSITIPSLVWTMNHSLGFKPSGWLFFDLDGGELLPAEVTDITTSVALAVWQTPMTGYWSAS